jgi:glycosyltransferase involved in cell wall biosynthesis
MKGLTDLRVLVTHDWLVTWGGAERVLTEILKVVPQADLIVAVRSDDLARDYEVVRKARETWVGQLPFARSQHRVFMPLHYSAFSGIDTSAYDLVISSAHAFAKAVRPRTGAAHVCYCHTPPRYLWGMGSSYREQAPALAGAALYVTTPMLREMDKLAARHVTHFVSNSNFVARRIQDSYGRRAAVVPPPVERKPVPCRPREDFLLVVGRLVPYKRVDLAIRAAERLRIPLVIAGEGPERGRLERMAGPRTRFVGRVDDLTTGDLMERCRAFVFCAEEDFGIAPVEANAHGAPVVGYAQGGLAESMVEGTTAVFFERQTVEDVARAIQTSLGSVWDSESIRANAQRFAPDRFRESFRSILTQAVTSTLQRVS